MIKIGVSRKMGKPFFIYSEPQHVLENMRNLFIKGMKLIPGSKGLCKLVIHAKNEVYKIYGTRDELEPLMSELEV